MLLFLCLVPFTFFGPIILYRNYYLGIQQHLYLGPILTLILAIATFLIYYATDNLGVLASFFCGSSLIASLYLLERAYSNDLTRRNKRVHVLYVFLLCLFYLFIILLLYYAVAVLTVHESGAWPRREPASLSLSSECPEYEN